MVCPTHGEQEYLGSHSVAGAWTKHMLYCGCLLTTEEIRDAEQAQRQAVQEAEHAADLAAMDDKKAEEIEA